MMTASEIIQHTVNALTAGGLFALYALGIALIFGIMRLVNFAAGELIMVGAYAALLAKGAPLIGIVVIAVCVSMLFALGMERIAFRPVRAASPATMLITSFAVSYCLTDSQLSVITIASTLTLLLLVAAVVLRTKTGLRMRAAVEDFQMARLVGIRADRVIASAFAISGALAGVTAFLLVAQTAQVDPRIGLVPVLFGFLATIIGGLGSLAGAVVGGFLLGAVATLLQATLPLGVRPFRDAFVFGAVFILLVVRPQGLFVARGSSTRV
jgi:branched-chain amino acid transport system permease protein